MKRKLVALLVSLVLVAAACSSDDSDTSTGTGETTTTPAVSRELVVPAVINDDVFGASISGWVVEEDGSFLLCEGLTEDDPPGCLGEAILISNGEVLDPIIFLGEVGNQYSDAEVVVTGDVVDGVLTIK